MATAGLLALSVNVALADDYAIAPVTGAAIVTHGAFTNLYLFPSSDQQTWDQHLAAQHSAGDALLSMTVTAIDQFTRDLTHSSYFDALTQYGVNPPTYVGDAPTIKSCVDAAQKDAQSGLTLAYGTLKEFVACERNHVATVSDQVNVFVSPEFDVAEYGDATGICASGRASAFHGWWFNVPNFTIIPTNPACSGSLAHLTEMISHEMAETISDPAGFGYIHEQGTVLRVLGDLNDQFAKGELGDICQQGEKNPQHLSSISTAPFFDTGLLVGRYWSNADNSCQPGILMNRTWLSLSGNPLVRMTGNVHDFMRAVSVASADRNKVIQQLDVLIRTGGDDLRGGSNDNCDVLIRLRSGKILTISNINRSQRWGNGELHAVILPLPAGTKAGDLWGFKLHTHFTGGFDGDNWNVNQVVLQGAVDNTQEQTQALVEAGGNPLVRFTGDHHAWGAPASVPAKVRANIVLQLQLTIATGGDDLRGGKNDNCDAVVLLAGGQSVSYPDVNQGQHWNNGEVHTITLDVPAGTKLGAIGGLRLATHFTGGFDGDNWNVNEVRLQALTVSPAPRYTVHQDAPVFVPATPTATTTTAPLLSQAPLFAPTSTPTLTATVSIPTSTPSPTQTPQSSGATLPLKGSTLLAPPTSTPTPTQIPVY